jgi:hypothetical protein
MISTTEVVAGWFHGLADAGWSRDRIAAIRMATPTIWRRS